ncbi:hypothetical protein GCM10009798_01620 [Nocardioides panacihumi]|uniref:PKD domain-containing protein n=1 Tax=Nocardioides panacihumi TaxID=400774 RepID=A0ABN2Q9T7_9ACTN
MAEAFERVLRQLRQGKGPDVSFRAYLLTTLRHAHFRHHKAERVAVPTDDATLLDQSVEDPDSVVAAFDRGAAGRAFAALPERWQMILWHLEVEGQRPAEVADLLGLKPNAVSALAYRAREALRQSFLFQHVAEAGADSHAAVLTQLPALARGRLGRRETEKIRRHLDTCETCSTAYAEVTDMNGRLSAFIAPVVLGAAAGPYLAGTPAGTLTLLGHPWELLQHRLNDGPEPQVALHKSVMSLALTLAVVLGAAGLWIARPEAPVRIAPSADYLASAGAPTSAAPMRPSAPAARARSARPHPGPRSTGHGPSRVPTRTPPRQTTTARPLPHRTTGTKPRVAPIVASFDVAPDGLSVTVHARARGGRGAGRYGYSWRFGDGGTARGATASHRYAEDGHVTIELTVTDAGRSKTVTRSLSVAAPNRAPVAFLSARVHGPYVTVDASGSSDPDGSVAAYEWAFGDGSTGLGARTGHRYAAPGRYLVQLTVVDDRGARASRTLTVTAASRGGHPGGGPSGSHTSSGHRRW